MLIVQAKRMGQSFLSRTSLTLLSSRQIQSPTSRARKEISQRRGFWRLKIGRYVWNLALLFLQCGTKFCFRCARVYDWFPICRKIYLVIKDHQNRIRRRSLWIHNTYCQLINSSLFKVYRVDNTRRQSLVCLNMKVPEYNCLICLVSCKMRPRAEVEVDKSSQSQRPLISSFLWVCSFSISHSVHSIWS